MKAYPWKLNLIVLRDDLRKKYKEVAFINVNSELKMKYFWSPCQHIKQSPPTVPFIKNVLIRDFGDGLVNKVLSHKHKDFAQSSVFKHSKYGGMS